VLAFSWPIQLSHFSGLHAALLFLILATPIVWLGHRSLVGLGRLRKWTAVAVRLLVLLLLVLILGGITWTRTAKDVHVMVLRDVSQSTEQVRDFPQASLDESINKYLQDATKNGETTDKKPADRVGVISFAQQAFVDSVGDTALRLDARAIRERGSGTDVASAIQLGLATLQKDAMHRIVLMWDGNQTTGDLEAALSAASAARVPIDVMPLSYDIKNEVLVDRFVAPTWRRENEPFTIDVILQSTNALSVTGKLTIEHQGRPMDLDPTVAGVQSTRAVTLKPGRNVERVQVPPLAQSGVHQFRSVFEPDNAGVAGLNVAGVNGNTGANANTV